MTTLELLDKYDAPTANGILAAAALSTSPDPGEGSETLLRRAYAKEAAEVIAEIKRKLKIGTDDNSREARVSVDKYLADALRGSILTAGVAKDALERAGQAGRLSPALYAVELARSFPDLFYRLGVHRKAVEEAILHPDDYQHLMKEDASPENRDVISLFMKQMPPKGRGDVYWLLVQTHRLGMVQIAQSAWRVYPSDVDLRTAECPLDVLKSFVFTFGEKVLIEDFEQAQFVYSTRLPKGSFKFGVTGAFEIVDGLPSVFASVSHTDTNEPGIVQVGIAYAINIVRYRASLRRHGITV